MKVFRWFIDRYNPVNNWRTLRETFSKSSPVRTDEFTIPLRQVGWGWGHDKTRWYKPTTSRPSDVIRVGPREKNE